MEQESVDLSIDPGACPKCGYKPKNKDCSFVEDYQCLHIICYTCGEEWVE